MTQVVDPGDKLALRDLVHQNIEALTLGGAGRPSREFAQLLFLPFHFLS